jgi:hypothetical protein
METLWCDIRDDLEKNMGHFGIKTRVDNKKMPKKPAMRAFLDD